MKIPLLDLKAQYLTIKDKTDAAIGRVVESQHFILGPEVQVLEQNIAAYCGVKYAVAVSSGTDALLVSLMTLDVGPGDQVIIPTYSFFATAGVVARLFAKPVFIDIDLDTFNIDPSKIEPAITDKIKAIIPVNLFGQCADMDPILEIARRHGLYVIEDAAQSLGAAYKGRRAGSIGHLGCFSFFPSKNLGGFGDGGMVVTNDTDPYEKVKKMRVHGSKPKYYHKIVGGNFRLDAIQAAVLNVKLKYLDEWSQKRRENAAFYDSNLAGTEAVKSGLMKLPQAVYKNGGDKNYHIYNQYPITSESRDRLCEYLKENGIGTEIYYPAPLHLQECFAPFGYKKGDLLVSEICSEKALSIPIYPELSEEQKSIIAEKIADYFSTP
jgi:dTDP-4-amino-4,6-dideoxygalactose transaminase